MRKPAKRLFVMTAAMAMALSVHAMPVQAGGGDTGGDCSFCNDGCPSEAQRDLLCASFCNDDEGVGIEEGWCDSGLNECWPDEKIICSVENSEN